MSLFIYEIFDCRNKINYLFTLIEGRLHSFHPRQQAFDIVQTKNALIQLKLGE